jgi:[ribosomal protein S5]-alanine N-acetyltransferase
MELVTLPAGHVVLRPHRESDIDGVLDQCQDPESQRWTTIPVPYTRTDAERFVLERIPAGWKTGDYLAFAIADPESDEFLGTIDVSPRERAGNLGFGLRPSARGRGVMAPAIRAIAEWSFDELGLEVLHWYALVGNWASRRAAWAAGFRVEGTVRGLLPLRGERQDGWVGSLRAEDPRWPNTLWLEAATIAGDGVRLRAFAEPDADRCVEACTDPVTRHWLGNLPDPYDREAALAYIRSRPEEQASARGVSWAAADPSTDRCVGAFGLGSVNLLTRSAEIGYWVHPDARGRGLATEAVRLLIRHCAIAPEDGGLGLRRLTLRTAVDNLASQRVAEKAGFTRTGVAHAAELLGDGSYSDVVSFDLLLE